MGCEEWRCWGSTRAEGSVLTGSVTLEAIPHPSLGVFRCFKGFRLVPLGLYPWVLGSVQGTLQDHIGPYNGYVRAILGKPSRALGVQPRNS